MPDNRSVGDEFEEVVLDKLGPGFSKTAGSGSVWKDGDIRHPELVVECKVKNTANSISCPRSELDHLQREAHIQCKDWMYVQRNKHGEELVLLPLDTLAWMTEQWRSRYERK